MKQTSLWLPYALAGHGPFWKLGDIAFETQAKMPQFDLWRWSCFLVLSPMIMFFSVVTGTDSWQTWVMLVIKSLLCFKSENAHKLTGHFSLSVTIYCVWSLLQGAEEERQTVPPVPLAAPVPRPRAVLLPGHSQNYTWCLPQLLGMSLCVCVCVCVNV